MPITKLSRKVGLKRKSELKRRTSLAANKKAKAAKEKVSLTSSDWMKFCDICFEFYVRFRDNWIDTLDGTIFQPGDYLNCHASHYISREYKATRYIDINCHAQHKDKNYAVSNSNLNMRTRDAARKRYNDWMIQKYGKETIAALHDKAKETCRRTLYDWQILAAELFGQAAALDSIRLQERLESVFSNDPQRNKNYRGYKGRRTLELIQQTLAKGNDDE